MATLGTAIMIAATIHEAQLDKGGNAYVLHPIRLMMRLRTKDEELMMMAILHDSIEDSKGKLTIEMLREKKFSERVLKAVTLLTHRKEDSYEEYIAKISSNPDAIRIKMEDLKDNSDLSRMKGISEKDFARVVKYNKAYAFLEAAVENFKKVGYCF